MTRTYPMTAAWVLALLSCALMLPGCGGSEKTPKTAASDDAAGASESTPSADASSPKTETAASEDAWEGEAEATGKAPSSAGSDGKSGDHAVATPDSKAEETRTTEAIANVIKNNRKPFRDCFDKGAKDLPDLEGTMTLHLVLDPEGNVKLAELNQARSDVKAPVIVDCAIAVLKGMKFPPSSRGMESTVNYPFDFKRKR